MRRATAVLIGVLLIAPWGAHAYGPAIPLCRLEHPQIPESSGIASSSVHDDVFFTHNDSGAGSRIYALDRTCRLLATIVVQGAGSVDWEDIARGPGSNGHSSLFVADTGNNNRNRPLLTIYEIPEPTVDPDVEGQELVVDVTASYQFAFDDAPQDVEALLVDPETGGLLVVSKALVALTGLTSVYALERIAPAPAPLVARRISTMTLATMGATNRQVTGGDISPDGTRLVIRTYTDAFEWTIPDGRVDRAFESSPLRIALPLSNQGEAIGYTRDGSGLLTTSEGADNVYLLPADG